MANKIYGWMNPDTGKIYVGEKALKERVAYEKKQREAPPQPGTPPALYDEAKAMLGDVTGLYEAGGAYDQAFAASKRQAMQGAQASMVGAGMANVYNPQASGAAYEAEARPAWELGRTQGLAGAMTNVAGLQAGRASELYQGGIQLKGIQAGLTATGMQTDASLKATGMQVDAGLASTHMQTIAQQNMAKLDAATRTQAAQLASAIEQQKIDLAKQQQQQTSGYPVSPFAGSAGMWG